MDAATLETYRANKDTFFATSDHSPIDPGERASFDGLRYFEHDPALVFTVPVEPGDGSPVSIATSDGTQRTYRRAGRVTLEIEGTPVHLSLYNTGHPGYFLPFRDGTSGAESYGAGRYLDLQPNGDGTVTIDFNLAYNPFCAYSTAFSCAMPPAENWVAVRISAGERSYVASHLPK
jgi:uncharacterized protein (DUF1684 family)